MGGCCRGLEGKHDDANDVYANTAAECREWSNYPSSCLRTQPVSHLVAARIILTMTLGPVSTQLKSSGRSSLRSSRAENYSHSSTWPIKGSRRAIQQGTPLHPVISLNRATKSPCARVSQRYDPATSALSRLMCYRTWVSMASVLEPSP